MSIANEVFEKGFDLYKFLTERSKSKNTTTKMLVRELRDNLKRLEHRNKKGVNHRKLIEMLSNEYYVKAVSQNFDFNKLTKGARVSKDVVTDMPIAEKYVDWSVEQLLDSVDGKIVALKDLMELYDQIEEAPINLTARLNNLYLLLVLITFLIRKARK